MTGSTPPNNKVRHIKPKVGLKLYNSVAKHKEFLPAPQISLYSSLIEVATWHSKWLPIQFQSLTSMRAYFVADWIKRAVKHNNGSFQLVEASSHANLKLIELDAPPRGAFCVEVAPFVTTEASGLPLPKDQEFSLDVIRYYSMSANYRTPLSWNIAALKSSQAALERLRQYSTRLEDEIKAGTAKSPAESGSPTPGEWRDRFFTSLNDDLNLTRALAVIWTLLQTPLPASSKLGLMREFDQTLGLHLTPYYEQDSQKQTKNVPMQVSKGKTVSPKVNSRLPANSNVNSKNSPPARRIISSTRDVRSLLDETDKFDFTVSLIVYNNLSDVRETLESLLNFAVTGKRSVEIIVSNLGAQQELNDYLEGQSVRYANFRLLYGTNERFFGEAAGRNLALRQGRGKYLLLLDAGLIVKENIFEPLFEILETANRPGLYGLYPLQLEQQEGKIIGSKPLMVKPSQSNLVEVEALDGSFLCFQRKMINEVGFLDERFRYPFALDLDYSYAFRDKKLPVFTIPSLSKMVFNPFLAEGRPTYGLSASDIEYQRQKNLQLFLKSWNL